MKRWLLLILLLLTSASALASSPRTRHRPASAPDILVIVADDLGWRDIDASVPTPSIDALREQGVSFPHAYVNANCSPSRFTLLFGRYGRRHGIGTTVVPLDRRPAAENPSVPLELVSLPEILRQARPHPYVSAAFGKWHLSNELQAGASALPKTPQLHGFDRFLAGSIYGIGGGGYSNWPRIDDGVETRSREYNTEAIFEATRLWWIGTPGPKFAWVAANAPHAPFHRPPAHLLPPGYTIGAGNRGLYEAAVVALDHEIGRLLEDVDLENTVVFFLGDNGTPQDAVAPDQNPLRVKGSMYEGGVAVPFIVAGTGVRTRGECRALVNGVDLYATVASLAGVRPLREEIDGVSFRSCFRSSRSLGRRRFAYSEFFRWNGRKFPKFFDTHMLRSRTHKLIVLPSGMERFFDMRRDPGEQSPLDLTALRPREQRIYQRMRRRLDDLLFEMTLEMLLGSP